VKNTKHKPREDWDVGLESHHSERGSGIAFNNQGPESKSGRGNLKWKCYEMRINPKYTSPSEAKFPTNPRYLSSSR
jgi:hypothetical protein